MEHFDFFFKGYTTTSNLDKLLTSNAFDYLRMVYGDLIYVEYPTSNFINVHRDKNGEYVVSQGLFLDLFPKIEKIGSIVPISLCHLTEFNYTGGKSEIGYQLFSKGFYLSDLDIPEKISFELSKLSFSGEKMENGYSNENISYPKAYYKNKDSYYFDFLGLYDKVNCENIKKLLSEDNLLFSYDSNHIVIHKIKKNYDLDRHNDVNTLGNKNFVLTSISWFFNENTLNSRNIYGGTLSPIELKKLIELRKNQELQADGIKIEDYRDTFDIPIKNNAVCYINTFNPIFYHGVRKSLGGEAISLISGFRSKI